MRPNYVRCRLNVIELRKISIWYYLKPTTLKREANRGCANKACLCLRGSPYIFFFDQRPTSKRSHIIRICAKDIKYAVYVSFVIDKEKLWTFFLLALRKSRRRSPYWIGFSSAIFPFMVAICDFVVRTNCSNLFLLECLSALLLVFQTNISWMKWLLRLTHNKILTPWYNTPNYFKENDSYIKTKKFLRNIVILMS